MHARPPPKNVILAELGELYDCPLQGKVLTSLHKHQGYGLLLRSRVPRLPTSAQVSTL